MSRNVVSRVSLGLLAAIAATMAFAGPAAAHSSVVASTPSEGEELTVLPERFSVTANEDLADVTGTGEGFALEIIDASGGHWESGSVEIDGATLSTPADVGDPGDYTLAYQIVSADGHPVSGEIHFTWAPEEEEATPVEPAPAPEPEVTTNAEPEILPISAPLAVPGWLGGAVAIALLVVGALTVASPRRR